MPAYAVVIKGTQVYNTQKGAFVDLSILDVMQIFGRAGRPQYETHGVGYILTSQDKLNHYVALITQQLPIESRLVFLRQKSLCSFNAACTIQFCIEIILKNSFIIMFIGLLRRWLII